MHGVAIPDAGCEDCIRRYRTERLTQRLTQLNQDLVRATSMADASAALEAVLDQFLQDAQGPKPEGE